MRSYTLAVALVLVSTATAFEMVERSPEKLMAPEGSSITLYCSSDEPFDLCEWVHVDQAVKCNVASTQVGKADACEADSRIFWDLDASRCGISIAKASKDEDEGTYKCSMVKIGNDSSQPKSVHGSVNVTVAVQAKVALAGRDMAVGQAGPAKVKYNELVVVECYSTGGFPEPQVRAALGPKEGIIDERSGDTMLQETPSAAQREAMEDGSAAVRKVFSFLPSLDDCGKVVKCEAVQTDSAGKRLFSAGGTGVAAKKIEVQFAPLPLHAAPEPFLFTPGDAMAQLDVPLKANPVPSGSQVVWTIVPTNGMEPVQVVAGSSGQSGKYEALPPAVSGHDVTVSLRVHDLTADDEFHDYLVRVSTSLGETEYKVQLRTSAPIRSTARPDFMQTTPAGDVTSADSGTIAAIVIVVVAIAVGLGFVFWAKSKNKCCFAASGSPEVVVKTDKKKKSNGATTAAQHEEDRQAARPLDTKTDVHNVEDN